MTRSLRITTYRRAAESLDRHAVVMPSLQVTRRRSVPLSRYDRLDPEHVEPEVVVRVQVEGLDRVRAALDRLDEEMKQARREGWPLAYPGQGTGWTRRRADLLRDRMRKAGWRV